MFKFAVFQNSLRSIIAAMSCCVVAMLPNTNGANESTKTNNRLGIAATVNDEMISRLDINSRLSLAIYLSKLNDNPATRRRLAQQILRNIIDDRLKLQMIRKNKILISQAEIINGIRTWQKQSKLENNINSLVKELRIDKAVIAEQVETQLGWVKLMRKLFLPTISFSEQEIDNVVTEEIAQRGKPEFLISEIFLPINQNTSPQEINALANRLIEQISNGAKFSAIARNFSQSPTSAMGGRLGWVRKGSLPDKLKLALETLDIGQVSQPIKTPEGFYILRILDKRLIEPLKQPSEKSQSVVIEQIHIELPPSVTPKIKTRILNKTQNIINQANSCKDMRNLGEKFGSSRSGSPGEVELKQLSPQIQAALVNLEIEKASTPIELFDGFLSVMICKRIGATFKNITKTDLRNKIIKQLINERINLAARQYLRDLRRTAVIDIRL